MVINMRQNEMPITYAGRGDLKTIYHGSGGPIEDVNVDVSQMGSDLRHMGVNQRRVGEIVQQ